MKHLLFIVVIGMILPSTLFSQSGDTLRSLFFNEVIITADKRISKASGTANSVSIITAEEIERSGKSSLYDILSSEQGIFIYRQGPEGGLTYGSIRGGNSNHLTVFLNGVKMNMANDPGNSFDFANINPAVIERIEIVRGPHSVLYGSSALAGVINIITKNAQGKNALQIGAEGGSYGTFKSTAAYTGELKNIRYALRLGSVNSAGFSAAGEKYENKEKDGWNNRSADLNVTAPFGSGSVSLDYRFMQSSAYLDRFGGKGGDDPSYTGNTEETAYMLSFVSPKMGLYSTHIQSSFFRNVRKYRYDPVALFWDGSSSIYDGNEFRFDWQNNIVSDESGLTFGIDFNKQMAVSEYLSTFFNSAFTEKAISSTGIYLQGKTTIFNAVLSAGVRNENHQQAGNAITYSAGFSYFFEFGTKIKATMGTGFKAPSLFYLYDPQYGNAKLQPEESKAFDAGFEQYFFGSNFSLSATWFRTEYKNLFGFDAAFKAINVARSEANGFELGAQVFLPFGIIVKGNFTKSKSIDKSEGSADKDLPLLRRPENKGSVSIQAEPIQNILLYSELIVTGERFDKDFNVFPAKRIAMEGYTLVNLAVTYKTPYNTELYTRFFNLLNKEYEDVYGFANPKLSVFFGFRYSL